jgi:ABC-2 type transport system ATP-binding protein
MSDAMTGDAKGDIARLEDVHVIFEGRLRRPVVALRGLSLSVPQGAIMGLLGPNGAGKTTAISCLLALIEPQAGTISLFGERVSPRTPRHASRTGVLLEDTRLPPFLSVHAALQLVCALRGTPRPREELDRVVARAGVEALLTRTVSALSKGQARRVGLAAALIGDPLLLILDEPSAGLDAEARVEFDALLGTLTDGSHTILLASHLLGDVEATCTHIAVVQEGRVVLSGRSNELLAEARRGRSSDVHVDAACVAALGVLGISHRPSRFPGLVLLDSQLPEEELFVALAGARITPRRVEPRVSMLSVYLAAMHPEEAS